ncbi:cell envelope integrity protein TolA [uncultured Paraglaciecola sp.]|uniref:cell envelope integrity protein TolA n=1 Tax=uncultured Paraglaciecola sp. TaxID=1765024 RepID=UPI0030DA1991
MSKLRVALFISLFMHVAVIVALLISGHFATTSKVTPEAFNPEPIIEAKAIDESQLQKQVQKVKDEQNAKRQKEENRIKELERRAADAEKKRKQQEAEVSRLKRETKQKELDKKKAEQAAVAAREKQNQEKAKAKRLEEERKRKELEKKKADERARQAKEKRQKEEKALKEAERKRQEAKEKAAQEKMLDEQLQAEQAARQAKRNKQVLSEVQKYEALISQTLDRIFIKDNAMKGQSCRFNIRLASNGLVIQVKELGGDPLVCRAGKTAILKAVELPVSKEPDVYEQLRNINFTFAPEI